jgi:hypothetical protein
MLFPLGPVAEGASDTASGPLQLFTSRPPPLRHPLSPRSSSTVPSQKEFRPLLRCHHDATTTTLNRRSGSFGHCFVSFSIVTRRSRVSATASRHLPVWLAAVGFRPLLLLVPHRCYFHFGPSQLVLRTLLRGLYNYSLHDHRHYDIHYHHDLPVCSVAEGVSALASMPPRCNYYLDSSQQEFRPLLRFLLH